MHPSKQPAMYAAIIDSSEVAIISKNLNSIILTWNKAAEKLFGYTEAEALGQHIFLIIPPRLHSEEDMIISNLRAGKKIEHFRTTRVKKDGKEISISLTISPIFDETGKIVGASKIARDITEDIQNETLIRQYAQSLETINEVGRKILSRLDYEEILQLVTDAATQVSGAAFGAFFANKMDAQGKTYLLYTLSGAPKEAFEKFGMPRNTEVFQKTFSGEGVLRSDNIRNDPRYGKNAPHKGMPEGHLPVTSYLAVPVKSKSGAVIGGLFLGHPDEGVFKEEQERIVLAVLAQAAIALENSQLFEDVKALNAKKDQFISMASHELKTPLTVLTGYLQLARELPEKMVEYFPRIEKQAKRLERIISDLLDISKIQAGKLDFKFENFSLHKLVKESVELVATEKSVITISVPEQDTILVIDPGKMTQVIVNLLSNAIKYSAKTALVTLSAAIIGDQVEIAIGDVGVGIPQDLLQKIFDQFYRVSQHASEAEGMGLGLFICKEIIDRHGGRIWAESEVGKGSTFFVRIPISR